MISVAEGWARLGIAPTDDKREVKRAYGRALKAIDPDSDPQAFVELRAAYETALQWGTETPFWEQESLDEAPLPEIGGDEEADSGAESLLDDSWWEPWRPELPQAEASDGLGETCQRLDRLLFDEPSPSPEAIVEAGEAVMSHPELAKVDRLTETELWLAEAITASSPRSDPLIDAAIARFGWKKATSDWRRHYNIVSVMARRDDIAFLAQCRRPDHAHHAAVIALSGPPPAKLSIRKLRLAGDVRRFLDAIADHPTVARDLDPDSLAWWRDYFHGRHLPATFTDWVVGTPMVLSAPAFFALDHFRWPLWLLIPFFVLTMAATAGILVGKAELDARSRRSEAERWGDERAAEGIERIVVPALLLPLAVALLPVGTLWASLSLTASLGLAAAGLRRAWVEPSWAVTERDRLFLPVVAAVAGLAALPLGTTAEAMKLVPPIAAMTWLGSRAFAPVQLRVQARGRSAWLWLMAGTLALIGLAAWLLLEATAGTAAPPLWMLMLAPTAIVAGHLAAAASPVDVHVAEWPLRIVAILLYFIVGSLGEQLSWLRIMVAISAYGLLYAGARLTAAIVTEARRPREQA